MYFLDDIEIQTAKFILLRNAKGYSRLDIINRKDTWKKLNIDVVNERMDD